MHTTRGERLNSICLPGLLSSTVQQMQGFLVYTLFSAEDKHEQGGEGGWGGGANLSIEIICTASFFERIGKPIFLSFLQCGLF